MFVFRCVLSLLFCLSLCLYPSLGGPPGKEPLGILTQALDAHLNEAAASPGLSVFDGEDVSTEAGGMLSLRVGPITLALGDSSGATLHGIDRRTHVDLNAGTVGFLPPENGIVEIHAEEAFLRPAKNELTQAEVTILGSKVLQIRVRRGDLAFSYRGEFQVLPQGETYRIYLDSPAEAQTPVAGDARGSSRSRKVSYFVMGAASGGLTAWGISEFVHASGGVERPAKP